MKTYEVIISYTVCGVMEIEAESQSEADKKAYATMEGDGIGEELENVSSRDFAVLPF